MILGNSAIGGTGLGNFNDPFYNYVTLLLTGANGSNATSNNIFIDNSQYGQPVTRNGDATQGSLSPYNGNYYSNFFDGTGDYLSAPSASNGFGTGDFTIEAWFFRTGSGTTVVSNQDGGSDVNYFVIDVPNANAVIQIRDGAGQAYAYGPAVVNNTWSHIAVTRSSGSVTVFVNGIAGTPVTISKSVTSRLTIIGGFLYAGFEGYFTGYISNLQIIKGIALYTSNFTPPSTAPLTAVTGTSLLTCQNNRFIDNSLNNYTITRAGDTRVQAFNPFAFQGLPYAGSINGGSMYFDGTGDWLSVTDNNTLRLSTGNFTIELWAYVTGGSSWRALLSKGSSTTGWGIFISNTGVWGFTDTVTNRLSSITVQNNVWTHLALVRVSTTATLYVNGVSAVTATVSTDFNQTDPLYIGCGRAADIPFTGYISDVRILKGIALYTSTFTPPTAPLQPNTNTVLLVNGTNASIFDRKEINDLAAIGDTQLRTDITRYNSTSIFFDGTGDHLYVPWNLGLEFGSGNFTIEFWAYISGGNTLFCWSTDWHYGMTFNYGGATSNRVGVWASSNGSSWNIFNADGGGNGISTGTITLNTWTHVAWVRNGSSWALYLNGTSAWTGTSSASIISRTDTFRIGGPWPGSGPTPFNGYLDDFRITNGIARYTANFTPPTYSPLGF